MALVLDGNGTMTVGNGSISGLNGGGLPDGSIHQADLTSGIAGTGPSFRATRSGTFNPSGSTWSKIQLNGEDWDTNSNYDPTTNHRFTPTVAGYYQFNAHLIATGSPGECYVAIYKNGSNATYNVFIGSGTSQWGGMISDILYANGTTDYFEMYTYTTASSPAISGMSMCAFLARAA